MTRTTNPKFWASLFYIVSKDTLHLQELSLLDDESLPRMKDLDDDVANRK